MTALEQMCAALSPLAGGGGRVLAALDGPCASGKTTLAGQAARHLGCPLVHMDDFFLPPARKTPARLAQPGGNVDWERVRDQVLAPLSRGEPARFSPYRCHTGAYGPPVSLSPAPLVLVEGVYALHPALRGWYDRTVFLTCSPGEQRLRLLAREGPKRLPAFLERWIPLEEAYFQSTGLPGGCDLVLDTTP